MNQILEIIDQKMRKGRWPLYFLDNGGKNLVLPGTTPWFQALTVTLKHGKCIIEVESSYINYRQRTELFLAESDSLARIMKTIRSMLRMARKVERLELRSLRKWQAQQARKRS